FFRLHHIDDRQKRVAGLEVGKLLAGGQLRHLFFFEFLDQVHGKPPSAAPCLQARSIAGCAGRACFYDKASALSRCRRTLPNGPQKGGWLKVQTRRTARAEGQMTPSEPASPIAWVSPDAPRLGPSLGPWLGPGLARAAA